jgi:hypothetical protein
VATAGIIDTISSTALQGSSIVRLHEEAAD